MDTIPQATRIPDPPPTSGPQPSFLRALVGLWSFTWRSNLSWTKAPVTALVLLVLPVLVFLTIPSTDKWARRHSVLGRPSSQVHELAATLEKAGVPLSPEQRAEFQRVFEEEFRRAEAVLRDARPGENTVTRQREAIQEAFDHVYDRTRGVLKEGQFAAYREFESGAVRRSKDRVSEVRWTRTEPFYRWLIDFYFFVILPLNCVRACGGLIRDEVQANTLGFLTTRPMSRARLLLAKYLTQAAWLQLLLLAETLLLFVAGWVRQLPNLTSLLPLFLGAQILAVAVWSALGTVLGQLTKRYMAAGLLYGLVVEIGIGQIPTNINNLSLIRQFKSLLSHDTALQAVFKWTESGVALNLGIVVLATTLFLAAAALLFTYREYHHTVEMQK